MVYSSADSGAALHILGEKIQAVRWAAPSMQLSEEVKQVIFPFPSTTQIHLG
jgi:hypothetical protein